MDTATGESCIAATSGTCLLGVGEGINGAPVAVAGIAEAVVDAVDAKVAFDHPCLSMGTGDGLGAAQGASAEEFGWGGVEFGGASEQGLTQRAQTLPDFPQCVG